MIAGYKPMNTILRSLRSPHVNQVICVTLAITHQLKIRKTKKNWLVVLTILKNISQWEGLSHILWQIKNV